MSAVHNVLEWAKREGDVKVVDRIRVRILPEALDEGIQIGLIDENTTCSPAFLLKFRETVSKVVGKPCPV